MVKTESFNGNFYFSLVGKFLSCTYLYLSYGKNDLITSQNGGLQQCLPQNVMYSYPTNRD